MSETLTATELTNLIRSVFDPQPERGDRSLALLVDLPNERLPDTPTWRGRRAMAEKWAAMLGEAKAELGLEEVLLCTYENVGANNADLPGKLSIVPVGTNLPETPAELDPSWEIALGDLLKRSTIFIAMTQLSATAPLKIIGRDGTIRAATMPGFTPSMIPALRLDYGVINERVDHLKRLLDEAETATIEFTTEEGGEHQLTLDLRHRTAHASGGIQRQPGQVGNLPSGETYIVPYEGEVEGEPSRSEGELPVQFGDEIVLYRIDNNKAVEVKSNGPRSDEEREAITREPAYANLAELGFGVLADFGVKPCGEILLDEKLGLHIAFGRSDHFGGQVAPKHFSAPDAVVHIDRVYLPETQPKVSPKRLELIFPDGRRLELMRSGTYAIELGSES